MDHPRISSLPTRLNAETAWEAYRALVMQADADASLWGDFKHCQAMSRAYRKWSVLFLQMDQAA
ncbi:MAG: hypothetical protein EON59_00685 [Alphaproteobacteria bacterium]|nr:MAG: hypothetical protein EON59_00685 [Alphaproteobacteria bacterium]